MEGKDTDHDLLIRLDQKVDDLHKKVGTLTDDHEFRIRTLEQKQWFATGMAGVISAIATLILSWFLSRH